LVRAGHLDIRSIDRRPGQFSNRSALEESAARKMNPGRSFELVRHSQNVQGSKPVPEEIAVRVNLRRRTSQHFGNNLAQDITCSI
jgi:hypothetical protein